MGFSSGLPLPLTFGTLSFWLAESGVSRTAIGFLGLVGTAYSLKFLWAPLIDRLPLGAFSRRFGRRRAWALAIQALLAVAIFCLGFTDPKIDPWPTAFVAVVIAFLSASQDIVIDAYRIEILRPDEQGAGAAATQWGYRFGLMASSAGALFAAEYAGWSFAFAVMACLMAVGALTVWFTREPAASAGVADALPGSNAAEKVAGFVRVAVIGPFAEFASRPSWMLIVAFVVLYKFGDALAGGMANPFYVAMGFTRVEVATISKIFGIFTTLAGVAAGGGRRASLRPLPLAADLRRAAGRCRT